MITRAVVLGTQHLQHDSIEETLFRYKDAMDCIPLYIDIYPSHESSVKDHIFEGEWKVTTTVQDQPLHNHQNSLIDLDIDSVHQTLLDMNCVDIDVCDDILEECETLYRTYQCTLFGIKNISSTDIFDSFVHKIEAFNLPISTVQSEYNEDFCSHIKEYNSSIRYEIHSPLIEHSIEKDIQLRTLSRHSKLNIFPISINALDACILHTNASDVSKDIFSFLKGRPVQM
jgi:hypothetical protein